MSRFRERRERLLAALKAGRGGDEVLPTPVELEPPCPLAGMVVAQAPSPLAAGAATPATFIRIRPSRDDRQAPGQQEQLLASLPLQHQASFEVVGHKAGITLQLVCAAADAQAVAAYLCTHFPRAEVFASDDLLRQAVDDAGGEIAVRCYRLAQTHLLPLRSDHKADPYRALAGVLTALPQNGFGCLQVVFAPVRQDWRRAVLAASRDETDPAKSAFVDLPQLPKLAARKGSLRLFAVSLRLAASSPQLLERLEAFLEQFADGNRLVPVRGPYPTQALRQRSSYASGMVLNAEELAGLVHLPEAELLASSPIQKAAAGAEPPALATQATLVPLGMNRFRGRETPVGVSEEWLTRHVAVFGATGTGKTTLLSKFVALVDRGYGLAFLDPAGDAAEDLLCLIPQHRIEDTIYFNPADRAYPPALNVLESSDEREKAMLGSDLMVAFQRLFADSWGPRLEWILRQAINTLLWSEGEKTLRDIPRLLSDSAYRRQVLQTVDDPDLLAFWERSFPRLPRGAAEAVLNKVSQFVDNPLVRNVIAQPNRLDFHRMLREGKVFIANLSKGLLGEDTATLLGSLILSKLQIAAMGRQAVPPQERRLFAIIIDEFHNYAGHRANTASLSSFLAEARKYKVALVVSTQYASQLHPAVADALFANVGTLIVFRCGIGDAELLRKELRRFAAEDILNLGVGEAIVRMGRAEDAFNVKVSLLGDGRPSLGEAIARLSRQRYCRPREEVERLIREGAGQPPQPEGEAAARRSKHGPGIPSLPPDQAEFLRYAYHHPQESVSGLYKALGLGGYKAGRIKGALLRASLLEEVNTSLGQAGKAAKFLLPTAEGCRALGLPPLRGKGGPLHRYLQLRVQRVAEARGYAATVEAPIPGCAEAVDVALVKEGRRTAVEVAISSDAGQEAHNVQKALAAGYDRVFVVCQEEGRLASLEREVRARLGPTEQERVEFRAFSAFEVGL